MTQKSKDINSIFNIPINFNEARIINYHAYKKIRDSCTNFDLLPSIDKCIFYKHSKTYVSSNEWSRLSINVLSKLSLNFPIVYDIIKDKDDNIIIYYEKPKLNKTIIDEKTKMKTDFMDEILFQKILIGYTLYNAGFNAYTYYYDIYDVPPTNIIFKIKDLFFLFNIKKLVLLSSKTQIITERTLENNHLNTILKDIKNSIIEEDNGSYIKYFLKKFIKNLEKKMFPTIPNQLSFETERMDIDDIKRGIFVKFNNVNIYNYGILVDVLGEECEIWYFSENKNKKDFVVIFKKTINELYKKENIIFLPQLYTIGNLFN